MRALRKIIFVNSAHIRYAEVRLDGNVHFIGTQGVGKSTLLRAILFFYNADKKHLGIPQEMKGFDDFYLPHANSYIVYEVEHEHGPFSILMFRNIGRACYRFINAEFRKEWLVDKNGEVTAESKVIRERLAGAYMSKIIDRYEQYRDILYGNKQTVGKEFARFQLMETNRYQNIPRSIQNVFLNSRLDANFIKDIIIRSMSEEEANVDLGYFRSQVSDFEQEYKDISCWYRLNQKGESDVRKQADAVVKVYHELLYMKQQITDLCGELNYAVRSCRERLPLVEKKINELQEEQRRQNRLLDELQQKFDTEKSGLNQEQGVVNDQIKRMKERKEYYATQRIEDVLKRYANEQILRGKLEEYKARLVEITTCFNDVTAKYKALSQSVKNQLENYRQAQNNRIIELKQENQQTMERMLVEYSKKRDDVDAAFADKILLATQVMGQLKDEQVGVEKEILKLKYWQPYKDELDGLHQNIEELALREKELDGLIATSVANINQLQAQYDKQEAAILANANKLLEAKQQEIDETTKKLTEIEKLLSRTKGSLYEWLKENKHDWEQNIGKVIDEENVLYQTGLHPEKGDGTSCFGVKLDITDLPLSVRKPTQLKEEKTHLDTLLRLQKNEYASLRGQQEKQVEELKHQFSPKMKELRFQKSAYETELRTIPQKRKAIQVKMDDYVSKAKQEVEQRSQELKNRQQENAQRRTEAETGLAKVNTDKQKQLANIDKQYQKAKVEAIKLHEQQVAEIRADIKQQEQKTDVEFQQLSEKYQLRRQKYQNVLNSVGKELSERFSEKNHIDEELQKADRFAHDEKLCPPILAEGHENQTLRSPGQTVEELTGIIVSRQSRQNQFKGCVNVFKGNFSAKNTFHFRMELNLDDDYLAFANNLDDFLVNNMIEEYRRRTSERYVDILARISKDMGELTRHESDVHKVINDINNDFRERNFAGVIKLIALQSVPSADKMVQLMKRIKDFHDENQFAMGELNLFSSANRDDVNQKAVDYLLDFMKSLLDNPQRQLLSLSDLFQLKFRIIENDNDTGWADKLSHVGSEGTDTLVKAMVNIMLINVFKEKVSRKFGDFRIHCMMDEIGKLHPQNVKGILDFANARNILLINSSPTTYNVSDYRYTYLLSKDGKSQTVVHPLISQKETITDITDK